MPFWFTREAGMDEGDFEREVDDEEGDEEGDGEDDESDGSANPASAGAPQPGASPAPGAVELHSQVPLLLRVLILPPPSASRAR